MGQITLSLNQTGYVVPAADYNDSGWVISTGYAVHFPCNPGYMTYLGNLNLTTGQQYDITYQLDQYVSGSVYPLIGASHGTSRTSNGTYTDTLIYDGVNKLQFYSDGYLRIKTLSVAKHGEVVDYSTFSYHERERKWNSYYSYPPEFMMRFINDFFSFKGGQLWQHNTNEVRNNFYGIQGVSRITFYCNIAAETVKNFYRIRQQGDVAWGSPNDGDILVLPYMGKPNGQKSRLKKGNYQKLLTEFYATFLRDLSDPRFNNTQDALFKGADLQGNVMQITLETDASVAIKLVQVDIATTPQNFTY